MYRRAQKQTRLDDGMLHPALQVNEWPGFAPVVVAVVTFKPHSFEGERRTARAMAL